MKFAERCTVPLLGLKKRPITWAVNKGLEVLQQLTVFRSNRRYLEVWLYSLLCLVIRFGFQCYLVIEMGGRYSDARSVIRTRLYERL